MGDALCRLPDGRGRDSRYLFADIFNPSHNCRRRRSRQQRNEFDFSPVRLKTAVEACTIEPSTVSAERPDTGRRLAVSAWACQGLTGADLISLVPAFIWRLSNGTQDVAVVRRDGPA
jgi:hypothetical protein